VLPIYNNQLFQGSGSVPGFGFPLTATWLQLVGVVLVLMSINVISHFWKRDEMLVEKSWIFGKKFLFKW
jgi:hypothetical protein